MKQEYYIKPPASFRKVLKATELPEVSTYRRFLITLLKYNVQINNSFGILNERGYQLGKLHLIRMFCDSIFTIYAATITDTKDTFLNRFLRGKPTNNQKKDGIQLTTNKVKALCNEKYEGISALYDECNRYVHPSYFFKLDKASIKKLPDEVLEEYADFWFKRPTNINKHKDKIEFIFLVLNNIFYDAVVEWYNEVVVPACSNCQTIKKGKKVSIKTITYNAYEEWAKATNSDDVQDS